MSSWRCTTPPGPPTQALRDSLSTDISFFDGTRLADASPAAFLLGAPRSPTCTSAPRRGAPGSPPTRTATRTCAALGVGAATTLFELDIDPDAAAVFAAHPDLRRIPIAANIADFVGAPVLDARLNELNLFATDHRPDQRRLRRGRIAGRRLGADRRHPGQRHQPRRRRRTVGATSSSTAPEAFVCSAGRRWPTPPRPAHCAPVPACRTSAGPSSITPPPVLRRSSLAADRRRPACRLDINDVIVGSSTSPTSPGRTSTSRPPVLQDFARTGCDARLGSRPLDHRPLTGRSGTVQRHGDGHPSDRVPLLPPTPVRPAPAVLNLFDAGAGLVTGPTTTAPTDSCSCGHRRSRRRHRPTRSPSGPRPASTRSGTAVAGSRSRTARRRPPASSASIDDRRRIRRHGVGAAGRERRALPRVCRPRGRLDLYGFDSRRSPKSASASAISRATATSSSTARRPTGPATRRRRSRPARPRRRRPRSRPRTSTSPAPATRRSPTPTPASRDRGLTVVGRVGRARRRCRSRRRDRARPVQVSSYNASTSNQPYVLRVRDVDPPHAGVHGVRPHRRRRRHDARPRGAPRRSDDVILVNQQRLGDTFGPAAPTT